MTSPRVVDASWEHLFPAFAAKLRAVLAEVSAATGEEWVLYEG